MSWSIGLSLGESFAEFTAIKGQQKIQTRWFLPKRSVVDGLEKVFSQNPDLKGSKISVTTKTAQLIMRHRAGSQIALLVTSGFEEWPQIRQPIKDKGFTLNPRRFKPLLSQDLIFGITERTGANGEILTPLKQEDLEFLIPKLQLTETKQVAVGFLHANKNPEHEKKAAQLLRENGFEVLCSHEIEESHNEVARWWRAVLNAYVAPAFHELETQVEPLKEKYQIEFQFISSDGKLFSGTPNRYYSSAFGNIAALSQASKNKKARATLHLGLEQFLLIYHDETQPIWQSDFGPVALPAPRFYKLRVQPTQVIENNALTGAHFSMTEIGYEPGPMLLGRTIRPTVLDVIYNPSKWGHVSGLSEWVPEAALSKLQQTLHTLFKDVFENRQAIRQSLEDLCFSVMSQEIFRAVNSVDLSHASDNQLLCTGALAPFLVPELQKKLSEVKLVVDSNADYSESVSAAALTSQKESA